GNVTLQQLLQREDFRDRIKNEQPIHAHEIQYPIMQAYDSVMVTADVELGGTDQLFNILLGRDLQRMSGLPEQIVLLTPILEGLDGKQKMSKSFGNYVALNDPPAEMFGKLMSISDELMARYYLLLLSRELPRPSTRSKQRRISPRKLFPPITLAMRLTRRRKNGRDVSAKNGCPRQSFRFCHLNLMTWLQLLLTVSQPTELPSHAPKPVA